MLKNLTKEERAAKRSRIAGDLGVVAIPERMRHLKVDKHGYAIPYGVVVDKDGTVHFAINDEPTRIRSITDNLCSMCGTKLFRGRWLVGGALSAFHADGAFIDPPMHSECAHYALVVCPYLAAPRWTREVGIAKARARAAALATNMVLIDNTMMPGRPSGEMFIALMTTRKIDVIAENFNVKPRPPYQFVEYWRHGKRLSDDEGKQLVATAISEFEASGRRT